MRGRGTSRCGDDAAAVHPPKLPGREFSGIAYECEAHVGHHVVGEGYIVEVLKDGRPAAPGEIGEVVVTDLNNYCLPFIRYRIGDLAEALDPNETCACGRGLPRIGRRKSSIQRSAWRSGRTSPR